MDWGELNMQIEPQYLGVIVAILVHGGTSIWWASKMNTSLSFLIKSMDGILRNITINEAVRYTKEEAAKDFALRDKQLDAIWKKLDSIHG